MRNNKNNAWCPFSDSTYLTPHGLSSNMSDMVFEGERQLGEGQHHSDGSDAIPVDEKF